MQTYILIDTSNPHECLVLSWSLRSYAEACQIIGDFDELDVTFNGVSRVMNTRGRFYTIRPR